MPSLFLVIGVLPLLCILGIYLASLSRKRLFTLKEARQDDGFLSYHLDQTGSSGSGKPSLSASQNYVLGALSILDVTSLGTALADFGASGKAKKIVEALKFSNHATSVPIDGGWLDITPFPDQGYITVTWASLNSPKVGLWNRPISCRVEVRFGLKRSRGTFYNREKVVYPTGSFFYKFYVKSAKTLWIVRVSVLHGRFMAGGRLVDGVWVEESIPLEGPVKIEKDWNIVPGDAHINVIYQMLKLYEASFWDHLFSFIPFDLAPWLAFRGRHRAMGYWFERR